MKKSFNIIGLMSGTSLDGLDIAFVKFDEKNNNWIFKIVKAETVNYEPVLIQKFLSAHVMSALELKYLEKEFSEFCAKAVNNFTNDISEKFDLIASHGHTVFHQPEKGMTLQIGDGELIAKRCGINVISDFRSGDVALGGQGAPLVPIGDELLFYDYDACVNLGGFSNISFKNNNKKRVAFDICPVNIVLNHLCQKIGEKYDENGKIASENIVNKTLLAELNDLDYYFKKYPKSLGREWVEKEVFPILEKYLQTDSVENIISTFTIHIAFQISENIKNFSKVLFTGGGAYNGFLIKKIEEFSSVNIVVPENKIVDFKEALIFAFLGLLRWQNKINCLASVTGAERDSCCGKISFA
ncbi:MAG TPA: anhydro-N-acetylmuramic acid kinase [Bacteroidales bacterium]|nr:anhydro-N-acetylmuramic acid kinase [Bacteroidales bacterium]